DLFTPRHPQPDPRTSPLASRAYVLPWRPPDHPAIAGGQPARRLVVRHHSRRRRMSRSSRRWRRPPDHGDPGGRGTSADGVAVSRGPSPGRGRALDISSMIAPARVAAYEVATAVSTGRADLPDALASAREALRDDRDRALTADIAIGVQRWRAALDHLIA